jgi:hypothetical protein
VRVGEAVQGGSVCACVPTLFLTAVLSCAVVRPSPSTEGRCREALRGWGGDRRLRLRGTHLEGSGGRIRRRSGQARPIAPQRPRPPHTTVGPWQDQLKAAPRPDDPEARKARIARRDADRSAGPDRTEIAGRAGATRTGLAGSERIRGSGKAAGPHVFDYPGVRGFPRPPLVSPAAPAEAGPPGGPAGTRRDDDAARPHAGPPIPAHPRPPRLSPARAGRPAAPPARLAKPAARRNTPARPAATTGPGHAPRPAQQTAAREIVTCASPS